MAAKTLQSLVSDQFMIGEVILTDRTSTPAGQSLLDCDGSIVTNGAHPLLEAVLPVSCHWTPFVSMQGADGTFLNSLAGHITPANTAGICHSHSVTSSDWSHFLVAAAAASTTTSSDKWNIAACSGDGVKTAVASLEASSNHFEIYAGLTGSTPSGTPIELSASGTHVVLTGWTIMNTAGTKVITGMCNWDVMNVFTSGSDIVTGYTSTDVLTPATHSVPNTVYTVSHSDDLTNILLATNTGLFHSADSGASWTEPSPPTEAGDAVFINAAIDDTTNDIYALAGSTLYRSVDAGVNWTTVDMAAVVRNHRPPGLMPVTRIVPSVVGCNSVGDLIVLSYGYVSDMGFPAVGEPTTLFMSYSRDSGATWSTTTQTLHNLDTNNELGGLQLQGYSTTSPGRFSQNGNHFCQFNKQGSVYKTYETTVTPAVKVRPLLPGYKIVAD